MLVLLGLATGGGVLFLTMMRGVSERRWRDWEALLNANDNALCTRMRSQLDASFEAIRLLDLGYVMIERAAPDLRRLLAGLAVYSRMVSAVVPVRPLRPREFKVTQVASLAALNQMLHRVLVSTAERFRLRLYIIGQGVGMIIRFLAGTTRRIRETRSTQDRDWNDVAALRSDFRTLTDESMESFRACLASLAAQAGRLPASPHQEKPAA